MRKDIDTVLNFALTFGFLALCAVLLQRLNVDPKQLLAVCAVVYLFDTRGQR